MSGTGPQPTRANYAQPSGRVQGRICQTKTTFLHFVQCKSPSKFQILSVLCALCVRKTPTLQAMCTPQSPPALTVRERLCSLPPVGSIYDERAQPTRAGVESTLAGGECVHRPPGTHPAV